MSAGAKRKSVGGRKARATAAAIELRGGRLHNLRSVDVDVPLGQMTVVCGVSGSGKTSLAFDTLYAEGQRRYIESFSSYARQFLQRLDRPDYDRLDNLPPSIAVTRKGASRNNRSTVSANSEIDDYLRLMFAAIAVPICLDCGATVRRQTADCVLAWVNSQAGIRAMPIFAIRWEDATDLALQLAHLQASGFVRLIVGGQTVNLTDADRESLAASLAGESEIAVVVDRLTTGSDLARWSEALETAFDWGEGNGGLLLSDVPPDPLAPPRGRREVDGRNYIEFRFHEDLICDGCGREYPAAEERLFSFNSPLGACPRCEGLAEIQSLDLSKVIPDPNKTLRQGAVAPWNTPAYEHELEELIQLASKESLRVDVPYADLSQRELKIVHEGSSKHRFGGLKGFFKWLDRKKYKMHVRVYAARWQTYYPCPECHGQRLKPEALAFRVGERNISDINAMTVSEAEAFFHDLRLDAFEQTASQSILPQITRRLATLRDVGLDYLQLDRPLRTLSGGELTRVNLTSVLGSGLVSMLYVLDEPTVGLHPADSAKLIGVIEQLRDRGNTVLIVDHEPPLIEAADHVIEVGPMGGRSGGEIVFTGSIEQLRRGSTLTGRYLRGAIKPSGRPPRKLGGSLMLRGCRGRNLKNINVEFPQQALVVVSGVSGSGKSTLINETLYPAVQAKLGVEDKPPLEMDGLDGVLAFDECLLIDQGTAARSSRSLPVTLVKAFEPIRSLFAASSDAARLGLTSKDFSFNNAEGRCGTCEGAGFLSIDMIFLADIEVTCPDCHGQRYRPEVLAAQYRDRSIAEVLDMTVNEAIDFFRGQPQIVKRLELLRDVGLDYVQLGQTSSTLSAGESQRLKLANYLQQTSQRRALIIMDEPTTGLHPYDVDRLVACLQNMVDRGHSLVVVEHNEQMIAAADWVIDIGPGSDRHGGRVVTAGNPKQVAACAESKTGYVLSQKR